MIHSSVHERRQASRAKMMRKQHNKATPVYISVGDSVVKEHLMVKKLTPKFSGTFFVTENFCNKFRIKDNTINISEIVYVDRLKKVDLPVPSRDLSQSPLSSPTSPYNLRSRTTVSAVSSSFFPLDERDSAVSSLFFCLTRGILLTRQSTVE